MAPDAEWLIDNYYVVEEQLREIREDLPRQFYLELPKLAAGPWAGFPRVYELAHYLVTHTDSNLDEELVASFVSAFQRSAPLTSGEVWAIPIMLRLVLVENLRRLCEQMLATREYRRQAEQLIEGWQGNGDAEGAITALVTCPPLVMQFMDCARTGDAHQPSSCLRDLESHLEKEGRQLDDLIRMEHQRLAANQVSIGNLITSMRLISALDWSLFFERVSPVEQLLRKDPAGVYAAMDFTTRDRYRHVIEQIAKRRHITELEVASTALELAEKIADNDQGEVLRTHVGYYLIDAGRPELEQRIEYSPTFRERVRRLLDPRMLATYLSSVGVLTALGAAGVIAAFVSQGAGWGIAAVVAALALLPISDLAITLVNFIVTKTVNPKPLPKLEFKEAIPSVYRTMVVMPTLLTSSRGVRALLERLEVHFLANPETGLQFALLTDFADAAQRQMPDDAELLRIATEGIRELNARLGEGEDRFCLFHRERRWNGSENCWMGWERKRGKLVEFNRLLRGADNTSFVAQVGDWQSGPPIQFIITLDADTRLPHSSARKLVATIAHPLNRARNGAGDARTTRGYGILQPRVSVSLESARRSLFSRIYANSTGLDPYCTTVSDVYQDLYREGSFTGKGIFDLDIFRGAIDDSFPENQILSHDLIEGCHTRVGLVTDIELFDEYPMRYDADARRQHRWVRGDWQLLPWLKRNVPTATGAQKNPLSGLSRWKVFDNLRRSLTAPSLVLMLLVGWLAAPQYAWLTTTIGVCILALPFWNSLLAFAGSPPTGSEWRQRLRDAMADTGGALAQSSLAITFVAYKAYLMVDAVARTLWRMLSSKRHMLEWETADAAERRLSRSEWSVLREMAVGPLLSVLLVLLLPMNARIAAAPFLLAWLVSPLIAYWISRPVSLGNVEITADDRQFLRRLARRTWAYFEQFVTEEDSWLPPDNYQEFPKAKVAHRVSPTNAGLYILSAIGARDFRHISLSDLTTALERNLESLDKLEMYCGHYYNWYDTRTLTPLRPCYVSTADSGNLACCFIAAGEGLLDVIQSPLIDAASIDGLRDTANSLQEAIVKTRVRKGGFASLSGASLESSAAEFKQICDRKPNGLLGWRGYLEELSVGLSKVADSCTHLPASSAPIEFELSSCAGAMRAHITGVQRDLDLFAGWVNACLAGCESGAIGSPDNAPALRWADANPRVRMSWEALWITGNENRSLQKLAELDDDAAPLVAELRAALSEAGAPSDSTKWADDLLVAIRESARSATAYRTRLLNLRERYDGLAHGMDFCILYNAQRRLFAVGYNHDDGKLDRVHYDLLASEARLASLFAIGKGDVDHRHWFQLGRSLTETEGHVALLSWGGTMFEYLMPTLFTHDVAGSLIERSCRAAVNRQMQYGNQRRVPWGISESAFSALAVNSDYHYQSFGVPGLGLKRGLSKDLVISPYSTALALGIAPVEAVANLRMLTKEGADGPFGLYDAIDYTPERLEQGTHHAVVACYMAHHHGMSMVAFANCLLDNVMRKRFQRHALSRATELLLQERVPHAVLRYQPGGDEIPAVPFVPEVAGPVSRKLYTAATEAPRTHLLSNGQYSVMVTNSGGGYSNCGDVAITRWRSDRTCDGWGQFIYLRDLSNGHVWSAAYQPVGTEPESYVVTYSLDKAEFRRRDGLLETILDVAVSPENNAEVRQIAIANHGTRPVVIEVTSYAEIVLSQLRADLAHPAFNKLFIETEYVPEQRALLARRRPRDSSQKPIWAVHVLASPQSVTMPVEYETDRARFLGRGRTPRAPAAMMSGARLSGTVGPVLDPVFSLRSQLRIEPDSLAVVAFITAYATSREEALALADQYHDPRGVQRTFELAWAHSQIELRHLHISPATAQLFQRVASAVLFPEPALRAPAAVLASNRLGQSSLWRHGISGDDPIVLLRLTQPDQRAILRELLLSHEFWHMLGLKVDLVVINENAAGYFDGVHDQLMELIQTTARVPLNRSGGVYLLRSAHMSNEDRALLEAVSTVSLVGDRGSLEKQFTSTIAAVASKEQAPQRLLTTKPVRRADKPTESDVAPQEFRNEFGGFTEDGREYVLRLKPGQSTPAPWSNVIANPEFGCLVTESGGGFTWALNSRENKLTSWANDPVTDAPSEVLYLRDDDSGEIWSPTPVLQSLQRANDYVVAHGQGYSRFVHDANGIRSELTVTIAPTDRVKILCLKIKNQSERPRRITATFFAELVLGVARDQTQLHLVTAFDRSTGALVAQNHYHSDLPEQLVFLSMPGRNVSVTGDRTEFLGRNGTLEQPAGLQKRKLSGATGAGLDPCGAMQTELVLDPSQETAVHILFGQCDQPDGLYPLVAKYDSPELIVDAMEATREFWDRTLGALTVSTPNRALDFMINRWLPYQTLSCRIWGRSAFYQSGGAYGYRDQLQDVMAMVYSLPQVAREQILRAASRQFEEGDVQHWWHPPTGRGVRTRFSDDLLWLPLVTCHYVRVTGDTSILDEKAPYLRSPILEEHEDERYEQPAESPLSESVLEHCIRAIEKSQRFGEHKIPLMGCGDWNDGMNKVGAGGKGESVWMGWFLAEVLNEFAELIEGRGQDARAAHYRQVAKELIEAVETSAWDGKWYRRAYFDDGSPLGSAQSEECRIDSLAQSWAVKAGGNRERAVQAMQAVDEILVRQNERMILLFDPPFDKTPLDPGYIKGYLPGIRENGGQYTHAAMWVIEAHALLGNGSRAAELWDMLNPIRHTEGDRCRKYVGEPYVIAADVYGCPPHVGRAGWTWYTGSASWMYRVVVERILGFEQHGESLRISPCIPADWPEFRVVYRYGRSTWVFEVLNPNRREHGTMNVTVDGIPQSLHEVLLRDDGQEHLVRAVLV